MRGAFLAYIMPINTDAYPDNSLPVPQPPFPGSPPGVPTHPIYYPPGIWGPTDPRPGWGLPGQPPGIWGPTDPRPTPPIHIPGQPPLGIWGPTDPRPSHPIVLPPGFIPGLKPEHPIVIPPPSPGVPTHPIVLPPDGPPEVVRNWEAKAVWSPSTGWTTVVVPVGNQPVPTPSKT